MKLRDTTNDRNGDDLYHLLSIVIVVFVSLLAWGVQSYGIVKLGGLKL